MYSSVWSLAEAVKDGYAVTQSDLDLLTAAPLETVCAAAHDIRLALSGNGVEFCAIINGKQGQCSEDCVYCAQSAQYDARVPEIPLIAEEPLMTDAVLHEEMGIHRYAIVTSGKRLSPKEIDGVCDLYRKMHQSVSFSLCASHGLLGYLDFLKLKQAGVTRYHNNLETSRRFFPSVCTTHTYDDKLEALHAAKCAGLELCSGGIIGLGETLADRIDMAFDLRALDVASVPLNLLSPIAGTPCAFRVPPEEDEMRLTVALYRFILPRAVIRLAGGRTALVDGGESILFSGANAMISGNMLTTAGISTEEDCAMLERLNMTPRRL